MQFSDGGDLIMDLNTNAMRQRGFTLVEIAIVLVVIGLLLGGILKGQELINNAKVRAITDRQNSLKVAWFSFIDRYASLPGDYALAHTYIAQARNGNGDGLLSIEESVLAFQHMAASGYLRCPHCTGDVASAKPNATNSLTNHYGGVMSIWSDGWHYQVRGGTGSAGNATQDGLTGSPVPPRLQVHSGPRIPSSIVAEVDRKVDDGNSNTGDMFFSKYDPTGNTQVPPVAECTSFATAGGGFSDGNFSGTAIAVWRHAQATPPVWQNCGAGVFI